ncbi:2-oxo-4-hydroxy-4-carboxy-5-ureidoimidazoline decarboxylase [Streptomyces sp. DHE17-7]|uniref:2-oxo-4-hydroxy-4-carboxy-5-ureidoimidazoline decarboxylase n=1 Tax=Streptomyces sp. DHE17-7 TaxID=2759949 RepID=UPI0022EA8A48|nr:2-oxo-4-hydroxy-4-carboxy-5-ureidoimidazoline decarboxylase [Streptomyces sp. DHE17-7]MBJ6622062.1 2-oxo-4-hydroxy-4-carboxy-5-ureidoimidazoline decarboxylase [Streptomyces sp. DHE17-7]
MTSTSASGLARFNALEESAALAELHEACASTAWARHLLAAARIDTAERPCTLPPATAAWPELRDDPRRGDWPGPPFGRPSRRLQPEPSSPGQARMAAPSRNSAEMPPHLNLAYQDKFGHVFLICATGRTGEQMRDAVKERIGNSPEQEREIVRTELGKIKPIR